MSGNLLFLLFKKKEMVVVKLETEMFSHPTGKL